MRRREFIALVGASVIWPFPALAREPGRTYRLGMLTGAAHNAPRTAAFFDELKMLGFLEGQNLKIVGGGFGLHDEQFAESAATLAKARRHPGRGAGEVRPRRQSKNLQGARTDYPRIPPCPRRRGDRMRRHAMSPSGVLSLGGRRKRCFPSVVAIDPVDVDEA
jgi:hypothetical protein